VLCSSFLPVFYRYPLRLSSLRKLQTVVQQQRGAFLGWMKQVELADEAAGLILAPMHV